MYLESNFNNFKDHLLRLSNEKEEIELQNAKEYSEKTTQEAKKDSKDFLENSLKQLHVDLEELKKQTVTDIELNYIRKKHLLVKKHTYKIKQLIKEKLEKEFDVLSECFLKNICENFDNGELKLYKEFKIPSLKSFDIKYIEEKKIVFEKDNKYIEFSVDLILREYESLIKNYLGA